MRADRPGRRVLPAPPRSLTTAVVRGVHATNLPWLVTLRWGAIAGQVITIAVVHVGMGIALPLRALGAIVGIAAASNVACALWARRERDVPEWMIAAVMLADVVLLTALLYVTGGPSNPFSFLYLVNI